MSNDDDHYGVKSTPTVSDYVRPQLMPDTTFWLIAVLYSLVAYLHGHQGSHLAAIKSRRAELNPVLLFVLLAYNWLFFVPWLLLVWYGYKNSLVVRCWCVCRRLDNPVSLDKNRDSHRSHKERMGD